MKKETSYIASSKSKIGILWLKSLLLTITAIIISWIVIENCSNSSIVVVLCILLAVGISIYSAIEGLKIDVKYWVKIVITCFLPSSLYLFFVLYIIYIIFFAEWSMKIGF